ncbi:hypothetical protein MS3_00001134 [Schistosoma haematobium]|uniref:Uncharacterized protein n=1 Tax=Schistosoma haematobium TaxID=6185 RepID=A0A922LU73_SCHHA|nr:hypothetical protein MS3_00001134 [Schistosoma haematobium]KAH9593985.1 hypothetical protein MS3_00001134 [Schistosoma haematobium]
MEFLNKLESEININMVSDWYLRNVPKQSLHCSFLSFDLLKVMILAEFCSLSLMVWSWSFHRSSERHHQHELQVKVHLSYKSFPPSQEFNVRPIFFMIRRITVSITVSSFEV